MSDALQDLKAELRSLTVEQFAEVTAIETWRIYQMIRRARHRPASRWGRLIASPFPESGSGSPSGLRETRRKGSSPELHAL